MKSLQDLSIFNQTAQLGSLTAAGRQLNLTPAACSAAVKRLEADLGVALFVRSTRHLRLTHDGERFLVHVQQALESLDVGVAAIKDGQSVVRGTLMLSIPSDLGRNYLLTWLDEFMNQYPDITLRIQLTDHIADMYRQPVDLALRYGMPADSSLIAMPIMANNVRVLCAAPSYLERFGSPESPQALTEHNCLTFMVAEHLHDRWQLFKNNKEVNVKVSGDRSANDGDAVRRWAVAGKGIAFKSLLDIQGELNSGQLTLVCESWEGENTPLNLICAHRRQLNPAVQALRGFLMKQCAQQML
ncbi:LysR family transcriptional regulator [Pseudomonas sp. HK3]